MNTLKPKKLQKGDTIGVVAPSSTMPKELLEKGVENLQAMGYKVVLSKNILNKFECYSATDNERAEDINTMFKNDKIDAIICVRGGYGAIRILEKLDYDAIKSNPKIFGGYSDITSLHLAFFKKTGLVTFHSPMLTSDMANIKCQNSIDIMINTLSNTGVIEYKNPDNTEFETFKSGYADGVLIGGNLAVLMSSFGTHYMPLPKDTILYIEDIDEKPYKIDRMLSTLLISGEIGKSIKAIVLGDFTCCDIKEDEKATSGFTTFKQTIIDRFENVKVPIISNVRCGHGTSKMTMAHGVKVEIDTDKKIFRTLENALV